MPVAETLGVAASIIAIVQISKTIISACHFYIDAADGASSDLRAILIEVSALKGIAKGLQYLTQPNVTSSALLDQLATVTGPIEGCKKNLGELEKLFPRPSAQSSSNGRRPKRRKLDAARAALAWPLKAGTAKKLLQEIMQYKTTINLALTTEFLHDIKDVKQRTEQIQDLLNEHDRRDVYKWLETTNPSDIHNRSRRLYEPGTASWILRTPEWPLWIEGKHRCLWLHGIPGAGKSILASYVAEEIEKHCKTSTTEGRRFGHAYYYCYFGHNQDESSPFLQWIIGQLCRQVTAVPRQLYDIYKSGKRPSLSCLLSILYRTLECFDKAYVVLDAVDESMPRDDLLRVIRDLSTDARFSKLSLLVTSREYIDIEQVLETCSSPISMSNPFVEDDIGILVRSVVKSDPRYQRWPEDLKCELQDTIPSKSKGMFRWAVCQLDALKRLKPESSLIRTALSNLPKTLDETYERIFLAIPEEDWLSVQHIFHWMVYHSDLYGNAIPLIILLQAVQQSTLGILPSQADPLHDFEGLRERCGCLIIISEEPRSDTVGVLVVSFAHYTVKEYLQSPRISGTEVGFFFLVQQEIVKHFAGIALHQASLIQPGAVVRSQTPESFMPMHKLIEADFKLYCVILSVLQLSEWPKTWSPDSTLMALSEALVNPHSPAYQTLIALFYQGDAFEILENSDLTRSTQFWNIVWEVNPDPSAAIFLNLLLISESSFPHMALAFSRRHQMRDILAQQLYFQKPIWDPFVQDIHEFDFEGSIPECFAQWSSDQPVAFWLIIDLISEHGGAYCDLSKLLLLFIGHNQKASSEKFPFVERLLSLGASANGPKGAFVTPLQIAAYREDVEAVELLLKAGARANALGACGSKWGSGSTMEQFHELHGSSPLGIVMNNPSQGRYDDELIAKLSEYGAVKLVEGCCSGGNDDTFTEDIERDAEEETKEY